MQKRCVRTQPDVCIYVHCAAIHHLVIIAISLQHALLKLVQFSLAGLCLWLGYSASFPPQEYTCAGIGGMGSPAQHYYQTHT